MQVFGGHAEDLEQNTGQEADAEDAVPAIGEADGSQWVALNKQFRKKSALWANSMPGPRLVMLAMTVQIADSVMRPFLDMCGAEWDARQRCQAAQGAVGLPAFSLLYAYALGTPGAQAE